MILIDGYDRRKIPARAEYRLLTFKEAWALMPGDSLHFRANDGTARRIRVTGRVKLWKRSPERLEVPMKYGFRECGTFEWRDGAMRAMMNPHCELLKFVRDMNDPIPASEVGL